MSQEQIEKDNAAYAAMSPMERRVRISEEIVLMLDLGKMVAGMGYGRLSSINGVSRGALDSLRFPLGDLQPIVRGDFQCVGCAKAAVIVAKAAVANAVHVTSMDVNGMKSDALAERISHEVFGKECAAVIEGLYEEVGEYALANGHNDHFLPVKKLYAAIGLDPAKRASFVAYSRSLPSDSQGRMRAIYLNIVQNGGALKVGDHSF